MIALEQKLQNAVNEGYLWLWDRTGISVGMLTFPLFAAEYPVCKTISPSMSGVLAVAVIGIWGVQCAMRHLDQMAGRFEYCNYLADTWRAWWVRWVFIYPLQLVFLAAHYHQWLGWIDTAIVVAWVNVWGCLIRERKPPEKRHALIPALSSSNSVR